MKGKFQRNGMDNHMVISKGENISKEIILRDARPGDYKEILRMNQESVQYLSPMDEEKLKVLKAESQLLWVVELAEELVAFIIAFREGAAYDSINYQWFDKNFDQFLYIDRVVVDISTREIGLGKLIYDAVFEYAKERALGQITAEIDIEPENPISLKFHQNYGFEEVGRQEVAGGTKVVSLQAVKL